MKDNKNLTRAQQVAVLGSSGDIATAEELALAEACGLEVARRRLVLVTGGDDGVMGAAARAAKNQGGTTVAVVPRDKQLTETWLFDSIVDTGLTWVQFSDALFRSCCGALIVGGGAGTIGELAMLYLNAIPAAFVGPSSDLAQRFGDHPLDARVLTVFPTFEKPADALDHIIARFMSAVTLDVASLEQEGSDLHLQSYPFGASSAYLAAAECFRGEAALSSSQNSGSRWFDAMARWYDALGDHFYYNVEDFFQAATYYARANVYVRAGTSPDRTGPKAFSAYLRAIMLESIALGFFKVGEIRLAKVVVDEAAQCYEAAAKSADVNELQYLKHSSIGLQGAAYYYEALIHVQDGRLAEASAAVAKAKESYDRALRLLPRWGEGYASDNYARSMEEISQLEARLSQTQESCDRRTEETNL